MLTGLAPSYFLFCVAKVRVDRGVVICLGFVQGRDMLSCAASQQPPGTRALRPATMPGRLLRGTHGSIHEGVQPRFPLGWGPRRRNPAAGVVPVHYVVRMLGFAGRARSCLPGDVVPVLLPVDVALLSGYNA